MPYSLSKLGECEMRAAVFDPDAVGQVVIRDVDMPVLNPYDALVKVAASSLTPAEERYSQSKGTPTLLGCDVAGVVEQAAADGSGPKQGERVIGRVLTGSWAEYVAVPTRSLAILPENISFEQGAALPTSALTALYLLESAGAIMGRKVLITAANGAVGQFACQIGRMMDAVVVGQVRRPEHIEHVSKAGADHVVVSADGSAARELGPYKFIAEAVGGDVLGNCLSGMIAADGLCAVYGSISGKDTTFNVWSFIPQTRAWVYAFIISNEFDRKPAGDGLARVIQLVVDGRLQIRIGMRESLDNIGSAIKELNEHGVQGKAIINM